MPTVTFTFWVLISCTNYGGYNNCVHAGEYKTESKCINAGKKLSPNFWCEKREK